MKWYEATTGNHQGLIIDENNGDNIAVAYDKKHARIIAIAPESLEALQEAYPFLHQYRTSLVNIDNKKFNDVEKLMSKIAPIIARATC